MVEGHASAVGAGIFRGRRVHAYGKLPPPNAQGSYRLRPAYVNDATNTVAKQLSKAGVRLAFILNAAFAP